MRTTFTTLTLAAVISACSGDAAPSVADSPLASAVVQSPAATLTPAATSKPPVPSASAGDGEQPPADGWIETGSFGDDTTIEAVHAVAEAPFGVIAAGIQLSTRNLSVFGPLPGGGRVWLSADGSSWEDVTPPGTFDGASINQLVVLPDGAVLALGLAERLVEGFPSEQPIAWETTDGATWEEVPLTVGGDPVFDVAAGPRGYLARGAAELGGQQLWHSEDGRTFAPVIDPVEGRIVTGIAAGPEGFVLRAAVYESADPATMSASANGMEWYAAATDGWNPWDVAPIGGDWIALDAPQFGVPEDDELRTFFSTNGLDWTGAAPLPVRAIPMGEGVACGEFHDLVSTGGSVVASATLSYPCGEGRVQRFGSAHITPDGLTWSQLPFAGVHDPADSSTRGTHVTAGLDLESGTLLVGEKDYRATFWLLPSQ